MRPTAKSLILDLLTTVPGTSVPVQFLVEAAAMFGIDSNSVRVALTRLGARGLIESEKRGQYHLGATTAGVVDTVSAWRLGERRRTRWDGGWFAVNTASLKRSDRRTMTQVERALRLLGLAELDRGLFIRADNLAGGCTALRSQLHRFGLPEQLPTYIISDLDECSASRALQLWDTAALSTACRNTKAALSRSTVRLEKLLADAADGQSTAAARAMTESFRTGGEAIRVLSRDPLLPDEIHSGVEREELVRTLRAYDALGRTCWSPLMKRHGLPHRRAPRDVAAYEPVAIATS